MTPLVGVWLDDSSFFCTGPTEQKWIKLRGNQNVALTTGCGAGNEVGRQWQFEVVDGAFHHGDVGEAHVFEVAPSKVLSFAKGVDAATRHRF